MHAGHEHSVFRPLKADLTQQRPLQLILCVLQLRSGSGGRLAPLLLQRLLLLLSQVQLLLELAGQLLLLLELLLLELQPLLCGLAHNRGVPSLLVKFECKG